MDNLYYYTYDKETKSIIPKLLEGGNKSSQPSDAIIGLEYFSPEKSFAEESAADYTKKLVQNVDDLENAGVDALYIEICKDCGRAFVIDYQEYRWYKTRDLIPPKRCSKCRDKRKKEKQKENKESK